MPLIVLKGLPTIQNYFELLNISGMSELPIGSGDIPSTNPQIFVGVVRSPQEYLQKQRYKLARSRP